MMMKYIVIEDPAYQYGDVSEIEFDNLDDAIDRAKSAKWHSIVEDESGNTVWDGWMQKGKERPNDR